jgi:hypothetical protein
MNDGARVKLVFESSRKYATVRKCLKANQQFSDCLRKWTVDGNEKNIERD